AHGTLTKKYPEITQQLFGEMDPSKNQLDWLRAKSRMVLLMLDLEQSVRPMDIPRAELDAVVQEARDDDRVHPLVTQMRAAGGNDYIRYARQLVSQDPPERRLDFGDYEFSMYDDMGQMVRRIQELEQQHGLCRMVAGFAWKWTS
ncbi:DNA/RNA helicase domain-containing protein, partial [Neisseria gonorrhoeae]